MKPAFYKAHMWPLAEPFGLEPKQDLRPYSEFSKLLPYQLGLWLNGKCPALAGHWVPLQNVDADLFQQLRQHICTGLVIVRV